MDIEAIKTELEKELMPKRFTHSIGVMNEAVAMAELFGADKDKARLAGLLHDCAKSLPVEAALDIIRRNGSEPDEVTLSCPAIIHAPAGSYYAREHYGVDDTEVLDAICYHTVARVSMTLLDKIIYVADMTEPNRRFDGVDRLRELARTDIDTVYTEALKHSIIFNLQKGSVVHPATLYAWNDICKQRLNQREENI